MLVVGSFWICYLEARITVSFVVLKHSLHNGCLAYPAYMLWVGSAYPQRSKPHVGKVQYAPEQQRQKMKRSVGTEHGRCSENWKWSVKFHISVRCDWQCAMERQGLSSLHVHPFMQYCRQAKQGIPDIYSLSNTFQLRLGDPGLFQGRWGI